MGRGQQAGIVAVTSVVLALGGGMAPTAQAAPSAPAQGPGWEPTVRRGGAHPALAGSLHDELDGAAAAGAGGPTVTVVVESATAAEARAAVEAAGGAVTVEVEGAVKAEVPAAALGHLADSRGVSVVREPRPAVPSVLSEGVAASGAQGWQTAGWTGTGVKVAVIDVGFSGYAGRQGTELPGAVGTDMSRCANPTTTDHGTAVAEIVHDMAPTAELLLVCIEDDVDFVSALGTMAAAGVDVVNGSFGFTGAGRGDGSGGPGTPAGAVAALRRQGILYVASAGNYGGAHWHGPAVGDTPSAPGGFDPDDLVDLTADDVLTFVVGAYGTAQVLVQWDSWTGPVVDFDLAVGNDDCGLAGFSGSEQTNGLPPVEYVELTNCRPYNLTFEIIVDRYAGTGTPRLDVFVTGDARSVEAPTGSNLSEPATSSAALAVGAHCYATGGLQPYSSTGPTIDGRIKPDISGPDATSSSVFGGAFACGDGFVGTSASAPHVAGAAALLLGRNPNLDVAELQQLLVDRAQDAGPAGDDNQYGAGLLRLGDPAAPNAASPPAPLPFTSIAPVRLLDTRPGLTGVAETPTRNTPIGGGVGQMYALPVTGVAGIPADARAVVLNVTVTEPSNQSYVAVQPGTNPPTTSNLNFVPGQTVAQHVSATIGTDGRVRIYNNFGTAHVVVDVSGWYGVTTVGGGAATDRFSALPAPARALDTRSIGTGYAESPPRSTPLVAGVPFTLPLEDLGGVPDGASGVVLNVTVTEPSAVAHLTVWPADQPLPVSSSVNVAAGQTVANLVVVKLGGANPGAIRLQLSSGSAHVVVDTIGWFQAGVGAGYVPLDPPARQIDTRSGTGPRLGALSSGETHHQEVGRYRGVPVDAEAAMMGVVAVTPTAGGFLTIFPTGAARPTASNVNFTPGTIVPNAVVAGLGNGGRVAFYNHFGLTHVVSDVSGYFLDPANVPVPLATPPPPPPPPPGFAEWQPPEGVLDGPATTVYLESTSGDYIGGGGTYTYTKADAAITASASGGLVLVNVNTGDSWNGSFAQAASSTAVVVGDYPGLHRYPFFVPGMSWTGHGRGCNVLDGRFIVDHVLYEGSVLDEVTLRFEQRCEGGDAPPLRGFVRYDADDPTAPPPPGDPADFAWHPPAGSVPATGTFLYMQSSPGDYIGQGRTELYTAATRTLTELEATGALFRMSVSGVGTVQGWYFEFAGPAHFSQFQVAHYTNLARYPFHSTTYGGLSFWGEHRGCNTSLGEVAVDSVVYNGTAIESIELRFVQRCELSGPPLYGALRWVAPPP